jgi:hypothetical protein
LTASSRPELRQLGLVALGASIVGGLARWQFSRVFTWQPPYDVEAREGRIEVRRYHPEIHAVTTIDDATWRESLNDGFRRLADYIFGANASETKIPMTSPVSISVAPHPASSPHTDDLEQQAGASVLPIDALVAAGPRRMDFVMPGDLTFADLPIPTDSRVRLVRVPARRVAALGFRGSYRGDAPAHKRNELVFLAKLAGLHTHSDAWFAGYDGPSTLPALRRNEVMIELED